MNSSHVLKLAFTALVLAFAATSCAPAPVITRSAQRVPVGEQVTLDDQVTSEQKDKIRESAAARFGGFGVGQWGRRGVLGSIVIAVDGEYGSNHYYDRRGSYNLTSTGAYSILTRPGTLNLIARPDHYQIPDRLDDTLELHAKAGHRYFLGYIVDETDRNLRWVPVLFDKTEGTVVPLKGVQPKFWPKPVTTTIYI